VRGSSRLSLLRLKVAKSQLPTGEEKTRTVRSMFDSIAPRYELINHLITFNLDKRWRQRAVRDLALPPLSKVLDVAAGTGDFCREIQEQGMTPFATDLSFGNDGGRWCFRSPNPG
jgi:demethylmenaquinone methyltransferase/2-methoxy-6-polyprenyl-1,4-benzoquinol methylase